MSREKSSTCQDYMQSKKVLANLQRVRICPLLCAEQRGKLPSSVRRGDFPNYEELVERKITKWGEKLARPRPTLVFYFRIFILSPYLDIEFHLLQSLIFPTRASLPWKFAIETSFIQHTIFQQTLRLSFLSKRPWYSIFSTEQWSIVLPYTWRTISLFDIQHLYCYYRGKNHARYCLRC